jgi:HK97 family phage prohead protease
MVRRHSTLGVGLRECYEAGCFARGIGPDIRVLINHDEAQVIGHTPKTATVTEDEIGVHCECDVAETSYGLDILVSLKTWRCHGVSSASFWIIESHYEQRDGYKVRCVTRALLRDCSTVAWPAYNSATAELAAAPAVKQLPAAGSTDAAWLRLIEAAEGPVHPSVAAAKLKLVKLGWRPRLK